jgi:hypothetical protein
VAIGVAVQARERVLLGVRRNYGLVLVVRRGTVFGLPSRLVTTATARETARELSGAVLADSLTRDDLELRSVRGTLVGGLPGSVFLFVATSTADGLHPRLADGDYAWSRARRPSVPLDPLSGYFVQTMFHMTVPFYDDLPGVENRRTNERRRWARTRGDETTRYVPLRSRPGYRSRY